MQTPGGGQLVFVIISCPCLMTIVNRHLDFPSGKRQEENNAHLGGGELAKTCLNVCSYYFLWLTGNTQK